MNTKVFYYILFVFFLASCTKSFLDRKPLDAIENNDFWHAPSDLKMYVNQYYPVFPNETRNDMNLLDGNSDNQILTSIDPLLSGTRVLTATDAAWNTYWSRIRSVNFFFNSYGTVSGSFASYQQYVGEAYFFRAYFYFDLLKRYGGIPWVTKVLKDDSEELQEPRVERNIVVDSIISDLDKAVSYMNDKGKGDPSRLNKQVALLFKSRVSLFEGTWEKYHAGTPFGVANADGSKYLKIARDAAKEVIDGGLCNVYSTGNPSIDYARLFGQNDYSSNPEILLWKKWDKDLGLVRWAPSIWGMGMGVTKELVDSYLAIDGLPISVSPLYAGDATLQNVIKDRDPRLAQSIWIPGDNLNVLVNGDTTKFKKSDIDQTGSYLNVTGYQLKKYSNMWGDNLKLNYYESEIGSIIFRYAEVLLNYAEARAELGEITQTDLDLTINKLRDRVGIPHLALGSITPDPDWDYPLLSPIINEVRRERRVELSFEGLRLNDLLRWRAHSIFLNKRPLGAKFIQADYPNMVVGTNIYLNAEGYIDPYQKALPQGYGFKTDRDYLSPIPSNDLTLNKNYVQNPRW